MQQYHLCTLIALLALLLIPFLAQLLIQKPSLLDSVQTRTHDTPIMAMRVGKTAFGAGCFWGTEKFFRRKFKDSLITTSVGYMGGKKPAGSSVSYEEVCSGRTGHAEGMHARGMEIERESE
jgi:Peptide methionine sulfoxide reductase